MSDFLRNLPTMAEVQAERRSRPNWKGSTRLQERTAKRPLTLVTERAFKSAVWSRDGHRCRCCGRKVLKTISRVPERGEVHHLHRRIGELRFEARAAILACARCHEALTGKVNERYVVDATGYWTTSKGQIVIDANKPIAVRKV